MRGVDSFGSNSGSVVSSSLVVSFGVMFNSSLIVIVLKGHCATWSCLDSSINIIKDLGESNGMRSILGRAIAA